ncbi:uncharacterized protein LOC134740166 [Pongo pygmaeus]|uniref:uncharacterized protein LOC134740166 n=1 Tax=Pongo pygmaeus TaxID=9600 RepID=UPI00300C3F71
MVPSFEETNQLPGEVSPQACYSGAGVEMQELELLGGKESASWRLVVTPEEYLTKGFHVLENIIRVSKTDSENKINSVRSNFPM